MNNGNRIDHNLTNHPPKDAFLVDLFEDIRNNAKRFGHVVDHAAPECREKSLALTNLEQSVMWAVAAIARHQDETLALHHREAA